MAWNEIAGYLIGWGALIALPFVIYKLFKTPPRKPRQ